MAALFTRHLASKQDRSVTRSELTAHRPGAYLVGIPDLPLHDCDNNNNTRTMIAGEDG